MPRWVSLLALFAAGCASSHGAPIAYGDHAARTYSPPPRHVSNHAAPVRGPRIDESVQHPDWADGPGTPLSDYALQPADVTRDPRRLQHHRVARGESFDSIARDYAIDARSLALLNGLQPPYVMREGDDILLPAGAHPGAFSGETHSASARTIPTAPLALTHTPAPSPVQETAQPANSEAPAGPTHFIWPLHGEVLAHFGPQPGGARLDGVEIAADEGAPIAAADDGDVVYAGADLNAYGTLVLVRHENGYVTAYGYARRALVREGQHVRKGQTIAEVGRVSDGPTKLLFQIRRGRDAVDPLPLLGGN